MPGFSTLQFYCSSYAFHLRASSELSAQSSLAKDRLYLIPCVAGRVLEITRGGHSRVWKFSRGALHVSGRANAAGISPCTAAGCGPRNAQSQQKPLFCGYDRTCAAPNLLIVLRRAPCLCNADRWSFPHARAIPVCLPYSSHVGPTRFPVVVPTQPCAASRDKIWTYPC